MNEYDSLEAELAALRPHVPSAALKQRIAESLEEAASRPVTRRRLVVGIGALAGGVLAAAVAILVWRGGKENLETHAPPAPAFQSAAAFDDSLPSLWSYRSALIRSPDSLEALLDQHPNQISELKPGRERVFVFARYDSDLNPLAGEL